MDINSLRSIHYDSGYVIIPDVSSKAEANRALDVFLSAVLDNHIPMTKIIGFALETPEVRNNKNSMRFVGSGYTLESVPEIANQLSKLVVLGWDKMPGNSIYQFTDAVDHKGQKAIPVVTGPNLVLSPNSADGTKLKIMQEGIPICRFNNDKVIMKVILSNDTGFQSMGYTSRRNNSELCGESRGSNSKFFYMNVNFSMVDFVRIIPPKGIEYFDGGSVKIRVKFFEGMNFDIFYSMWKDMFDDQHQSSWLNSRVRAGG